MSFIKTEPLEDLDSSFQSVSSLNPTSSCSDKQVGKRQGISQLDTNIKMRVTVKIEQDELESSSESELLKLLLKPSTSTFRTNLYEDHEIKEEMVIGPTVLQDISGVSCKDAIEDYTEKEAKENKKSIHKLKSYHNIKKSTMKKNKIKSKEYIKLNDDNKDNCNVSIDYTINSFEKNKFSKRLITTDENFTYDSNKNLLESAFICDYCQKIYKNKTGLVKHIQTHRKSQVNIKIYENMNCKIERHNITAQKGKEEDLKCNVCFKTFTLIANLKLHLQHFHVGLYRFECIICNKTFKRKDYLLEHNKAMHSSETKFEIYICICGNKYSAKSSYLRHKNRCNNNNKNTCGICLKEFCNPRKYRRHLRNHKRIKKRILRPICKCDFCGQAFDKKDRLVRHIHTNHTAVTLPHKCEICNKQYALKQSYKKHVSSHSRSRKPKKE